MEEGLAQSMVYGSGDNNTIKHYYAKPIKNRRPKKKVLSKKRLGLTKKCK